MPYEDWKQSVRKTIPTGDYKSPLPERSQANKDGGNISHVSAAFYIFRYFTSQP
jgi:hypothetical protein